MQSDGVGDACVLGVPACGQALILHLMPGGGDKGMFRHQ